MATIYFRDRAAPRPQRTRIGAVAVIMQDQRVLLERRADSGRSNPVAISLRHSTKRGSKLSN